MRCLECGAEFDEMNESQPVCPGCGAAPMNRRDCADIRALLEDAALMSARPLHGEHGQDLCLDSERPLDQVNMPADLQEAHDDAEALLQAAGYGAFVLPAGLRLFKFPTTRVM